MNRPLIAVIALIIAVAISVSSLVYIELTCKKVIDILDYAVEFTMVKNHEKTAKQLDLAVDKWEEIRPVLNIIIGQEKTTQIRNDLNKAIFFYNIKDTKTMLLYIEDCKMDLNEIIVNNEPMGSIL